MILTCFMADSKKRLWLSAEGKGIWIIDNTGKNVQFLDGFKDLPGYLVPAIYEDKGGTIWIATFRGLVKSTEKKVTHFTFQNGLLQEDIRSSGILKNGTVYMGINFFADGKIIPLPASLENYLKSKKNSGGVYTIALDSYNRLILFSYVINNFSFYNSHIESLKGAIASANSCEVLFNDKDSVLWFSNFNALYLWKNDSIIQTIIKTANGSKLNEVSWVRRDYFGNVWVAEKNRIFLYRNKMLFDFTNRLHLPQTTILQGFYSDSKGIWIGTHGYGAIHLKHTPNNSFERDEVLDSDHGLPSNHILSIVADNKNYLWIASLNGLCYVNLERKNKDGSFIIHPCGEAEGIDVRNWNLAYLQKDGTGNIWLGVENGVYKIDPSITNVVSLPPPVHIERVEVIRSSSNDKEPVAYSTASFFQLPATNDFSYTQNNVSFYFKGINLKTGYIRYQYMLEGLDKEWHTNQSNEKIAYYNLAASKYTFKVKAVNDYGEESATADIFSFEMLPPFWQTWWFRSIIALAAAFTIYFFIKRRDKRRYQKNLEALQMTELKLTALQSQMNPHFIFNSLNSIQNYIMQQKPVEAARYLSKFSKLMRRILDHSFNNLTPLHEIVETLKMYMELEAFRFSNEFTWDVKVDNADEINEVKLPPMLLQPYVENAIIHGLMPKEGEKNLSIHLYCKEQKLFCIVDDNGIGRGNKLKETNGHAVQ